MSKMHNGGVSWCILDYDKRKELMYEHGALGGNFLGAVVSSRDRIDPVDDYEWGMTPFCERSDNIKAVVYTVRCDDAWALCGDFGTFCTAAAVTVDEMLMTVEI